MRAGGGTQLGGVATGEARYRALLEVMDLVALHSDIDGLLPDLTEALRRVVDFDGLGVVVAAGDGRPPVKYSVTCDEASGDAPRLRVLRTTMPPIHETQLAAIWAAQAPVVVHDLEQDRRYPEIADAMRQSGRHAACLLPLTTTLRPVGLLALASSRRGAYDSADLDFLQRVASHVAIAIDNVRHHEEARSYQKQVEADRDHWRTLLALNNALVSTPDLASVLAAITPNLRGMIAHDYTSLSLVEDDGTTLARTAYDPNLPKGLLALLGTLKPGNTPLASALASRRPLQLDSSSFASFPEVLQEHVEAARVKRVCFVPLFTPRRALGGLVLSRCTDDAFTAEEVERAAQAGAQIAIALENALAFQEIAALRDRLALENLYLEDEIRGKEHFEEIIGESKALQRVLAQVRSVAGTDSTVLLLGETGTGKELIARAIHATGARSGRPMVTVNCATSPAGLLESEWFGHEKGAFTGALTQKIGRFELAHKGTLFLDEIGDVPLDLQAKLLRALQEHEIERLGSTRQIHVDFRLVAATNRNLEEMVAQREYRADLFYRLNVFPIRIPPLRERPEDIPPLVRYFVQRHARALRRSIESVPRETMDALCRWHWPGNVRELQNVIERAVILSPGPQLRLQAADFQGAVPEGGTATTLEDAERAHIRRALDDTGWVIGGPEGAAIRLGLKRTTLVSTMRRLGIVRPRPS
ncbi:sigma-54-dependent Fis family transcriptional regulator [Luteitalea sp.]